MSNSGVFGPRMCQNAHVTTPPGPARIPHRIGAATPAGTAGEVAAFFDLDHTIIATSASFAFNAEFIRNGMMSRRTLAKTAVAKLAVEVVPSEVGDPQRAMDLAGNAVRGMTRAEVRRVVDETLEEIITPKVFTEAKELIADHRRAGHSVVVLSAAASEMVEPIARMLGADQFRGTELEVGPDGQYTGAISFYCWAEGKVDAMRSLAEKAPVDFSASYAYSDSDSDIPMLGQVGHPVAVNPNRLMRREAVERGWPILEFSKPTPLFPSSVPKTMRGKLKDKLGNSAITSRAKARSAMDALNQRRPQ